VKKQQSQIQTLKRTITGRMESQDNGNINNFCKGQSLVLQSMPEDLLLFLTTRIKKMALWKTTCAFEHLNHAKSAKHIVDCHVFFQTRTHLH